MLINFLGNGSGFSMCHNNAYFVKDDELVIIDLSMIHLSKALELSRKYNKVSLVLTHMHDDHSSGMTLFAQMMYYQENKKLRIFIPDILVEDVYQEFQMKGVNEEIVEILLIEHFRMIDRFFIKEIIKTKHSPELNDKCFGYVFEINGEKVVYSGDTCQLNDFSRYIENCKEFYVDMSYDYGIVHLKWDDVKDEIFNISQNCDVYLMHLDNFEKFKNLKLGENIHLTEISD